MLLKIFLFLVLAAFFLLNGGEPFEQFYKGYQTILFSFKEIGSVV